MKHNKRFFLDDQQNMRYIVKVIKTYTDHEDVENYLIVTSCEQKKDLMHPSDVKIELIDEHTPLFKNKRQIKAFKKFKNDLPIELIEILSDLDKLGWDEAIKKNNERINHEQQTK